MAEMRWTAYDSIVTYLSVELNALANNANKLGAAIDFTATGSDRKLFLDIELYLASVDLSTQTNPAVNLWVLARTDGTNFEDGDDSINPARAPDSVFALRAVNGVQRVFTRFVLTTPDQGKIVVENKAGAALAATGNTLKYYLYSQEIV